MDMTNIIEVVTAAFAKTEVVRYYKKNDFFGLYIKINELGPFQKPSGISYSAPLQNSTFVKYFSLYV